jgi:dynein heavy chain
MLIGVIGCGRQSLIRLGSYMLECNCFQIKLSKSYKLKHLREDIKVKMLDAGCDATQ